LQQFFHGLSNLAETRVVIVVVVVAAAASDHVVGHEMDAIQLPVNTRWNHSSLVGMQGHAYFQSLPVPSGNGFGQQQ